MNNKKIYDSVIIGAGISGLNCALQLEKQQKDYLILEKTSDIGGRIGTESVQGFKLDKGFQVLMNNYEEVNMSLNLEELNCCYFKPGAIFKINGKLIEFLNPLNSFKGLFNVVFEGSISLSDKFNLSKLGIWLLFSSSKNLLKKNDDTCQDFLSERFSKSFIEGFFRPFLGGVFLDYELKTKTGFFFYIFKKFLIGKTYIPQNGMAELPNKMAEKIPNEKIRLNTPVASYSKGKIILENGEEILANSIVVACNSSNAKKMNPLDISENYNTAYTYYFSTKENVPEKLQKILVLNNDKDGIIKHFCFISSVSESYAPSGFQLISISINQSANQNEDHIISKIKLEFKEWFEGEIEFIKKFEIPESLTLFEGYKEIDYKISEGIYRCGDYLRHPSTNAAMKTGREVAEMLLKN